MNHRAGRRCDFSIVIPVYCNAGCLEPLFQSLTTEVLAANPERTGEIVFVDDGSVDGSFEELHRIVRQSPSNVAVIRLTRNFGQASALLAGYEHVRSDCVITISADGQEPPALVNEMLRGFFEENYEIVICARSGRDESRYRRITSALFYSLMGRVTFATMPKGGFDVWLMGRRALDTFLRNQDETQLLQWRVLWMGYKTKTITYRRRARLAGVSRFTLAKKVNAVLAGLLGYSVAAIRMILLSGCLCALLGLTAAAFVVADVLLGGTLRPWALVIASVLVVGGLQMTMLGVVGEYVWRVLTQARGLDLYQVDAIYPEEET